MISTWPRIHEGAQAVDHVAALRDEPVEQRHRCNAATDDAGMSLEGIDHRFVAPSRDLGEDPAEVADRLVVMEGERQRDARRHAAQPPR
jgi:hypothetical protein